MSLGEVQKRLKKIRTDANAVAAVTAAAQTGGNQSPQEGVTMPSVEETTRTIVEQAERSARSRVAKGRALAVRNISVIEEMWNDAMLNLYSQQPVKFTEKQCHQVRLFMSKMAEAGLKPGVIVRSMLEYWPDWLEIVVNVDNPDWVSATPHIGFMLIHRDAIIGAAVKSGKSEFLLQTD